MLGCYLKAAIHMLEMVVKNVKSIDDILRVTPPKVARLLEILKFFNPEARRKALEESKNSGQEGQNAAELMPATEPVIPRRRPIPLDPTEFSGIVFVEQRYVAYILKVFF